MEISDWISGIALLVSIIVAWFSIVNYRDQSIINQLVIQREKETAREGNQARIHIAYVNEGRSPKLKISNIGKSEARNLMFLPDKSHANDFIFDDKFPINLKPRENLTILVSSYLGGPSKYTVTVTWDDDFSKNRTETFDIAR
ncbi:hypothetical protein [Acinetobacter radioresistens]|uniref:Uncharacterized protein n=1 Tax=Acinetobacter radioresistens TaxID=40216 RepID=A0A8H2PQG3_ACIRA|nr:hypothetical protein [Acinetobacter radioresistens]MCK4115384.1 hypothetical protein [Acinetobacter radioresistens]MCU4607313.1 hypothetical protein [Acinetobacter radioresistens]MCU4623092.1 hypothetical protein [Acinetobacter radioresistens]MCX0349942.1 hypothetical protein [Acinetobacter radioresistens]TNX85399.1 hypothetical protein FHY67_14730 [Acinetobacter radioresistens]